MVLGVPVFYFILPLYSFSQMDDFSWGATRQAVDSATGETDDSNASIVVDVENNSTRISSQTELECSRQTGPPPGIDENGMDERLRQDLDGPDDLPTDCIAVKV